MTRLALPCAGGSRASLVVLSDRKPTSGAARSGVESAIERALREHDGIWLARPASEGAGAWHARGGSRDHELRPLFGDPAAYSKDDWAHYVRANTAYAERIVELAAADGAVWIHGDRWLLVAQVLRRCGHRGPIGLLFDAPFPARPWFEALPWHGELKAALCQLDLIGFQGPQWAHNFEASTADAVRRPRIGVFPNLMESDEWVRSFLEQLATAPRRDGPPVA
jgi:hypothetical protein